MRNRPMSNREITSTAAAVMALVCLGASAVMAQNPQLDPQPGPTVEPLVLMKAREIEGCGLTSIFAAGGATVTARFLLLRDETAARGTRFVLSASWPTPGGAGFRTLTSSFMATGRFSTEALFGKPVARQDGAFETTGALPANEGDVLMRDVMMSGAAVTLEDQDGERLTLAIPGPVSPSVRASYLNCAGDMFRPQFWPEFPPEPAR